MKNARWRKQVAARTQWSKPLPDWMHCASQCLQIARRSQPWPSSRHCAQQRLRIARRSQPWPGSRHCGHQRLRVAQQCLRRKQPWPGSSGALGPPQRGVSGTSRETPLQPLGGSLRPKRDGGLVEVFVIRIDGQPRWPHVPRQHSPQGIETAVGHEALVEPSSKNPLCTAMQTLVTSSHNLNSRSLLSSRCLLSSRRE